MAMHYAEMCHINMNLIKFSTIHMKFFLSEVDKVNFLTLHAWKIEIYALSLFYNIHRDELLHMNGSSDSMWSDHEGLQHAVLMRIFRQRYKNLFCPSSVHTMNVIGKNSSTDLFCNHNKYCSFAFFLYSLHPYRMAYDRIVF